MGVPIHRTDTLYGTVLVPYRPSADTGSTGILALNKSLITRFSSTNHQLQILDKDWKLSTVIKLGTRILFKRVNYKLPHTHPLQTPSFRFMLVTLTLNSLQNLHLHPIKLTALMKPFTLYESQNCPWMGRKMHILPYALGRLFYHLRLFWFFLFFSSKGFRSLRKANGLTNVLLWFSMLEKNKPQEGNHRFSKLLGLSIIYL